jgi:hypothetical protein
LRIENYKYTDNFFNYSLRKALCFAFLFSILNSQFSIAKTAYEIDIHYGFGTSELSYSSVPGIALSIYPIENFGFSAGLEYSWRWQTKTSSPSGTNPIAVDDEDESYILSYEIGKYRERNIGKILQVPLLLKYSNESFYVAGGLKIGSVKETRANINYEKLRTEGYYPKYDVTLTAPLFQGFGEHKDSSFSAKISSSKILAMLALEGGVKFKMNDNFSLILGAFFDYSLSKGFSKDPPPLVERKQGNGHASITVNHAWKSWQPWSAGAIVKLSFMSDAGQPQLEDLEDEEPEVHERAPAPDTIRVVKQEPEPEPQPLAEPFMPEPEPVPLPAMQSDTFQVTTLPAFLLNRKADFEFHYPESRTSPSDSLHLELIAQIADTLRAAPHAQLHCVGHSEKLISESVAYETALQRSLRIRYTLTRFYGINESRVFIYSQGSKAAGYRRAECFIVVEN